MHDQHASEQATVLLSLGLRLIEGHCTDPDHTINRCRDIADAGGMLGVNLAVMLAGCATHFMRAHHRRTGHPATPVFYRHGVRIEVADADPLSVAFGQVLAACAAGNMDSAYAIMRVYAGNHPDDMPDVLAFLTAAAHSEAHS
jgi:hypothetical protein